MKLQIKFKSTSTDGVIRKVTKTFSKTNENASEEQIKDFALAYTSLSDASDVEVYLIRLELL